MLLTGCSSGWHQRKADEEAYGVIAAKARHVPGMLDDFTIKRSSQSVADPVLPEGPMSLSDALRIATHNSRSYQTTKESLYLDALSLVGSRHNYGTLPSGSVEAAYSVTDLESRSVAGGIGFRLTRLFKWGTSVTAALTSDLSKLLTGNRDENASSTLSVTITQPLLRGFGLDTNESLVQAERNMVYDMRGFVRSRRNFYIGIVSGYYRTLQDAVVLENERVNRDNLRIVRERDELLYETGRKARIAVDQTLQDELAAADRYEFASQDYRNKIDIFKISLGLPAQADVVLESVEREKLFNLTQIVPLELTADRAAEIALERRLDLKSARDNVEDSQRALALARLDLRPGLDVTGGADIDTEDGKPLKFRSGRTDYEVGLDLDLPLDRMDERHGYRSAQISLERARRDLQTLHDDIVLRVRRSWRECGRARRSFEIQKSSLQLAARRVESTSLMLDAGRASTRDMLESRQDYLDAQNALVEALVDFRLAGLNLSNNMGILTAGTDGELKENFDAYTD
jgi:outer membrane protein TolC